MAKKRKPDAAAVKELEKKVRAMHDIRRGIPEARVTEVRAAQKKIDLAFIESNPKLKKAITEAQKTYEKSRFEIEKAGKVIPPGPVPIPGKHPRFSGPMGYRLLFGTQTVCVPESFKLCFIRATSTGNFSDVVAPVDQVISGLFGWGPPITSIPDIINNGDGDGHWESGSLSFGWSTTIPYDGAFEIVPNEASPYVEIQHIYSISGSNWLHDTDASVEISAVVYVYLDDETLIWNPKDVCYDATGFLTKGGGGYDELELPDRKLFSAKEGQSLGMIIHLQVNTCATSDGFAAVQLQRFAMPLNSPSELDIWVRP